MVRGSERDQLLGRHLRKFGPSESRRGYYYCARCGAPVSRREYEENHYRCPKCNARIFLKPRRRVIRTVRAM
jgi:DNA-directed RNA polymerase subunit RPC12/RpoP